MNLVGKENRNIQRVVEVLRSMWFFYPEEYTVEREPCGPSSDSENQGPDASDDRRPYDRFYVMNRILREQE